MDSKHDNEIKLEGNYVFVYKMEEKAIFLPLVIKSSKYCITLTRLLMSYVFS